MAHFMPIDEQKAERLNERLSKTIFRNVSNFVEYYNSGIINRSHDDVAKIAEEITKIYRDVKERGKRLIFISEAEVHLNEIYQTLDMWSVIIKVKRELEQHINDGELNGDSIVLFSPDALGYILTQDAEGSLIKINNEKLFTRQSQVQDVYTKHSSRRDEEKAAQNIYQFAASDFTNLNADFVTRIKHELPN